MSLKIKILFLIFINTVCFAQGDFRPNPDKNLWIKTSIGFMGGSQYSGLLGDFSIDYLNKDNIYSVEYFFGGELGYTVDFSDRGDNALQGVNFLFGGLQRESFYKVTYACGLSLIETYHSSRRDDGKYKYTVGLPLSTQLVLTPIQIIAIGINGYININFRNSIIGARIGIYFGKVK